MTTQLLFLDLGFYFTEVAPLHEQGSGHGISERIHVPDPQLLGQREQEQTRWPPPQFPALSCGFTCSPDNRSTTIANRCTRALSC